RAAGTVGARRDGAPGGAEPGAQPPITARIVRACRSTPTRHSGQQRATGLGPPLFPLSKSAETASREALMIKLRIRNGAGVMPRAEGNPGKGGWSRTVAPKPRLTTNGIQIG